MGTIGASASGLAPNPQGSSQNGAHIRCLPGEVARALVAAGSAEIAHQNGRVPSIRLVTAAATHAQVIGPATGRWGVVPFSVKEHLDCDTVVWKHHRRSRNYE
jgi:hypothetical protein